MATVQRYIDTDSAGGDGTTPGLSGGTAAYVSMNAWEAAEDGAAGGTDDHIVDSAASASALDATAVVIGGWTVNSITINGDQITGIWVDDGSVYTLTEDITQNNVITLQLNDALDLTINNLQVDNNATAATAATTFIDTRSGSSTINLIGCLVRCNNAGAGTEAGILVIRPTVNIINCVVEDCSTRGIYPRSFNAGVTNIYNTTVGGCGNGIERHGSNTTTVRNSAVFNNTDDFLGTFSAIDFCASDDGDGTNAVDISPANGSEADKWNLAFTDYSNSDFSVKDASSVLYNAGTDLSGSGVSDDIIGTARPQVTTYDIGAFELVGAPGGLSIPIAMHHYTKNIASGR